jgi:hypothetical protein
MNGISFRKQKSKERMPRSDDFEYCEQVVHHSRPSSSNLAAKFYPQVFSKFSFDLQQLLKKKEMRI